MTTTLFPLTGLVTLAMLLTYFWTAFLVAQARRAHGVKAPATSGPDAFDRVYRAHVNTLEQLVLMLPALWLFALWVGDRWAGLLGLVWIVGRVLYVTSYAKAAASRGPGFLVGVGTFVVAVGGAAIQMLRALM